MPASKQAHTTRSHGTHGTHGTPHGHEAAGTRVPHATNVPPPEESPRQGDEVDEYGEPLYQNTGALSDRGFHEEARTLWEEVFPADAVDGEGQHAGEFVHPLARHWTDAAVVDNRYIYVFGGLSKIDLSPSGQKILGDLWEFDTELKQWTCLGPTTGAAEPNSGGVRSRGSSGFPVPRHSHTLVAYKQRLVLFGGCGEGNNALNDLWIYDTVQRRWTRVRSSSPGVDDGASVLDSVAVASMAVSNRKGARSTALTSAAAFGRTTLGGLQGAELSNWPKPRYLHSVCVDDDGSLYLYGGWMSDWSRGEKIWRFDLEGLTWAEVEQAKNSPSPDRRFGHKCALWQNCMYVFGGNRSTGAARDMWSFSFATKKWTQVNMTGTIPKPRKWFVSAVVEDRWYVHGGVFNETGGSGVGGDRASNNNEVVHSDAFAFDFQSDSWMAMPCFDSSLPNQPCESHCTALVSGPFCHSIYTLFGRTGGRYSPSLSGMFQLDLFRTAAIEKINEDEVRIASVGEMIKEKIESIFRVQLERLAFALDPVRTSMRETVVPNLERQLRKVEKKIKDKKEEPLAENTGDGTASGDLPSPSRDGQGLEALEQLYAHLRKLDEYLLAVKATQDEEAPSNPPEGVAEPSELPAGLTSVSEKVLRSLVEFCPSLESAETLQSVLNGSGIMPEAMAQTLDQIADALLFLKQRLEVVWERYLEPNLGVLTGNVQSSAQFKFLTEYNKEFEEVCKRLGSVCLESEQRAGTLPVRDRRKQEAEKCRLMKNLLLQLDDKMLAMSNKLQESPMPPESSLEALKAEIKVIDEQLATRGANTKKATLRQEKILQYLDKFEVEKKKSREEALESFETQRAVYLHKRKQLLEDVQAFVHEKLEAYNALLLEERSVLLEAELRRRDEMETTSRLRVLKEKVQKPLKAKLLLKEAFEVWASGAVADLGKQEELVLREIDHQAGRASMTITEEVVRDQCRFEALLSETRTTLKKQHEATETAIALAKVKLKAKTESMSILGAYGDQGTESLHEGLGDLQNPSVALISAALYEVEDSVAQEDEANKSRMARDILQLQRAVELLEIEVSNLANDVSELEDISRRFRENSLKIQTTPASRLPQNCSLRGLLESGFEWEQVTADLPEREDEAKDFVTQLLTGEFALKQESGAYDQVAEEKAPAAVHVRGRGVPDDVGSAMSRGAARLGVADKRGAPPEGARRWRAVAQGIGAFSQPKRRDASASYASGAASHPGEGLTTTPTNRLSARRTEHRGASARGPSPRVPTSKNVIHQPMRSPPVAARTPARVARPQSTVKRGSITDREASVNEQARVRSSFAAPTASQKVSVLAVGTTQRRRKLSAQPGVRK